MNKLIFNIIWVDESMPDFIELKINVANDRLSADFSCYASLEELQKTWSRDVASRILSGNKFIWELQGSDEKTKSLKIEGFKANSKGLIILKVKIVFHEVYEVTEECTIMLEVEPAQLDTFGEKMKVLPGEYYSSVEL